MDSNNYVVLCGSIGNYLDSFPTLKKAIKCAQTYNSIPMFASDDLAEVFLFEKGRAAKLVWSSTREPETE